MPITTINASSNPAGGATDRCLLRAPTGVDETVEYLRYATLATSAERMFEEVADELLYGRRVLNRRLPDRSLIGFCDGTGRILSSETEISQHAREACGKILGSEASTDNQVFFVDTVAKRVVAHFYEAIVQLGGALLQQPTVTGEANCEGLIRECIRRAPPNSLKVYCACHTDPLKPAMDEVMAGLRSSAGT